MLPGDPSEGCWAGPRRRCSAPRPSRRLPFRDPGAGVGAWWLGSQTPNPASPASNGTPTLSAGDSQRNGYVWGVAQAGSVSGAKFGWAERPGGAVREVRLGGEEVQG